MSHEHDTHDIVAIGASAGSVDVLVDTIGALPGDLPASLFVAVHAAPGHPALLPEILNDRGRLPCASPLHGERVRRGHVYVAPPDHQLYLRRGSMEVVRGPRENGHRPSVDALFRTASEAYGSRVKKARTQTEQADMIRGILLQGSRLSEADAVGA